MKLHIAFIAITLIVGSSFDLSGQSAKKMVRQGNSEYEEGNFSEAEIRYRKAISTDPNYYTGKFNLGDAMYAQENFEESGKIFNELVERQLETEQKADVFYNLGNNFMSAQKYAEAVEAYKESLRLNPGDFDAKYNLEYARKMMQDQEQQQQQNQDQNQDQQKDQQDQQDQQQDQNQDEQKEDQQKQQQQNQDQQQNDKSDQQKQKQQQQQQISKEDAQKMLEALKNDEKKTLQELQKQKAKAVRSKKTEIDW